VSVCASGSSFKGYMWRPFAHTQVKHVSMVSGACRGAPWRQVAYSVIETTDADASLARAADIFPEMRAVKLADTSVDAVLLAVVGRNLSSKALSIPHLSSPPG